MKETPDVHFYELHEGDGDVFSDVLLFRDEEMDPEDFFELVQSIRQRFMGSFDEDTLIEAIANELERNHGFVFIADDRLTAAVNVSKIDDDNFLADLDGGVDDEGDDDPDGEGGATDTDTDFRSVLADFDPRGGTQPN